MMALYAKTSSARGQPGTSVIQAGGKPTKIARPPLFNGNTAPRPLVHREHDCNYQKGHEKVTSRLGLPAKPGGRHRRDVAILWPDRTPRLALIQRQLSNI
ncbi:hypothetical protein PMIN06_004023 [Paraphaeosphaeria minitans]